MGAAGVLLALVLLHSTVSIAAPALDVEREISGEVYGFSVLRGALVGVEPADLVLYRITVKLADGRLVRVFSREPLSPELFGKKVKALVRRSGDERGTRYWLIRLREVE